MHALVALLLILAATLAACDNATLEAPGTVPHMTIVDVKNAHSKKLMAIPGVVGIANGLCHGKPCIKVYVVKRTPELARQIPDMLDGYPVVIEETGEFRALPSN